MSQTRLVSSSMLLFMRSVRIAFFVRDESAEGKENLHGIFLALSLVSWPLFFLSCPLAPFFSHSISSLQSRLLSFRYLSQQQRTLKVFAASPD